MAYSDPQLRGALLEEAILYLLYASGYEPVLTAGSDPTLTLSNSGMEVQGRGERHQIDAIADFVLSPPFSNPQRLLVEAKFLTKRVGIPIVRNAVGVAKDVSEYWIRPPAGPSARIDKRYHYLYAIFSVSTFTQPAQNYAFAHDIHLLPLKRSTYFASVIAAIEAVTVEGILEVPSLWSVRQFVRSRLFPQQPQPEAVEIEDELREQLIEFLEQTHQLRYGFIAMFGNRMPVFLVARSGLDFNDLEDREYVRIRWIEGSWYVERTDGQRLFSFDLPEELSQIYASRGELDRRAVANIKNDWMRQFYAFHRSQEGLQVKRFELDDEWFSALRHARGLI